MDKNELRETRKQMFAQMEQRLQEMHPKEEDLGNYRDKQNDLISIYKTTRYKKLNNNIAY